MTHKIIQTENYLLIVDDSEIKEGDYVLSRLNEIVTFGKNYLATLYKKIIAHLPLNGASILDGVDLLPPLEDDIDLMYENMEDSFYEKYDDVLHYYSFIEGYNKSKERFKYTEEDIMKAIKMAQEESWDESGYSGLEHEPNKIIQSLQQPKIPIKFKCEVNETQKPCDESGWMEIIETPKTTINSQGQTQWVGKYIFQ